MTASADPTRLETVIVGDSFVYGAGVSKEDIFAVKLGELLGKPVYSYAPNSLNEFIADRRFRDTPLRTLLLTLRENNAMTLEPLRALPERPPYKRTLLEPLIVSADRLSKNILTEAFLLSS
jgi:hypothetical protein